MLIFFFRVLWGDRSQYSTREDKFNNVDRAFGVAVAAQYLQQDGMKTQFTANGDLQLGDRVIKVLHSNRNSYPPLESSGSEILLNYRSTAEIATKVTLGQILNNDINPQYISGKIVIVGVTAKQEEDEVTAKKGADEWFVPTNPHVAIPGVIVQAHTISQLLSAALDERSMLTILSQWQALGWVWTWAMVGCLLAFWQWQRKNMRRVLLNLAVSTTIATISLYGLCLSNLIRGRWLPFIPSALALILSSSIIVMYLIYRSPTRSTASS